MADVTTTFAAKDEGFAAVMQRLQNKLQNFAKQMNSISSGSGKIQSSFAGMTKSVLGLTTAYVGVSQAINGFNKALDISGQMADMSEITGESAGNLAVLERAFNNTNIGGEKMIPMLSRMTEFIQSLGKGQDGAVDTAKMLGVTFDQLKNKTPIQQFEILLRAIANLNTENKRLTASGDVFGNRMGGRLIPLARDFTGEMSNAREQLGSVVDILDRSAKRLDQLGDTLRESLGNKFRDFVLGLLDGARGANELATSLSKIDTAAAGIKLGQLFSGAVKEPHKAFLLMGEVLLLAVKAAGNALANSALYAGRVWQASLVEQKTFNKITDGLLAGFQMIFNFAANASLQIVKLLVQGIAGIASIIPGIGEKLAKSIAAPLDELEGQQGRINKQAEDLRRRMLDSMVGTTEDIVTMAQKMPKTEIDFFGAKDQAEQVKALQQNLRETGRNAGPNPETPAEQQDRVKRIYAEQVAAIRAMNLSASEATKKQMALDRQFIEAMSVAKRGMLPPEQQMKEATTSEQDRKQMTEPPSKPLADAGIDKGASETTLQKAVRFLEELTTKLPAPVLV